MAGLTKKTVLVPSDFSDTSFKALDHAILLAKLLNANITLLHVMEDLTATAQLGGRSADYVNIKELEKNASLYRKHHLQAFVKTLEKDNLIKVTPLMVTGRTHIEIVKAAKKINASMIVMGTHGASGIRSYVTGTNTYRVVKDAECPVLSVQNHTGKPGFKNILMPFSDRPHSREKVDYAIRMAKMYDALLSVFGVDTEGSLEHREKIKREADQIKAIAEKRGVKCKVKVRSEAHDPHLVLKHAKDIDADLIIIMSHSDKLSIADFFKEGFAHGIVNHSPIPVLSIPPTFNPDTIDLRFY